MSRIAATLAALREQRRKALIPYFTVGDPSAQFFCRPSCQVQSFAQPRAAESRQ